MTWKEKLHDFRKKVMSHLLYGWIRVIHEPSEHQHCLQERLEQSREDCHRHRHRIAPSYAACNYTWPSVIHCAHNHMENSLFSNSEQRTFQEGKADSMANNKFTTSDQDQLSK
ncbi:hypothetical protein O6H91_08G052300 [Diphasiastrum complanatum]|uniref:Uncharacterized protein n=1 Tax=Diphasiastrum complanatum TaxID=34168 RepID=A0ACC2CXI9_DIPCM|nr:hypothetical protein O6H91_Y129700 [Diphasiastrum complanatum]KAJ7546736.1 hypothetical protein O6H91_08G052300 [Diphasiastrum complanatum]